MSKKRKCTVCGKRYAREKRRLCTTCASRRYRKNNPISAKLNDIRNRARQRGIPFDVPLAEFKRFCYRTGYMQTKGRGKGYMSLDRIDNEKGYFIENLQVLEYSENSIKGTKTMEDFVAVFGELREAPF